MPRFGCVSMVKARGASIGVLSIGRELDRSRGSMHLRGKSSTCSHAAGSRQQASVSGIRVLGTVTPSYLVVVPPWYCKKPR